MKNIKSQILILCIVLFACVSFTSVKNSERKLKQTNSIAAPDKCFAEFLKSLKSLDAIVFTPYLDLDKLSEYGLTPLKNTESSNTMEAVDLFTVYDQVGPIANGTDPCANSVLLTYNDLKMLIFVNKSASGKLASAGLNKIDLKINNETIQIAGKHTKYDSFLVRMGNKEVKYTPVTW